MKTVSKMMLAYKKICLCIAALVCLLCVSCVEKNPLTGKKSLTLVDSEALFTESFAAYQDFLDGSVLLDDTPDGIAVREAGEKLRKAAVAWYEEAGEDEALANYRWEYHLVQNDAANAWCMPGGKIVVYSGILPAAKNETGLATVMSHEISHALLNHGKQSRTAGTLKTLGKIAAWIALTAADADSGARDLALGAYDAASTYLGILPFSRAHESEADATGIALMSRAGYDPAEAVAFWERMNELSQNTLPEFLSTHPSDEKRIFQLKKIISQKVIGETTP
jgi:predicted Zn-dependent protease